MSEYSNMESMSQEERREQLKEESNSKPDAVPVENNAAGVNKLQHIVRSEIDVIVKRR